MKPGWVWAPAARAVTIERNGAGSPLHRAESGWWRPPETLRHGDDYGFRVDGEGPFPDPRSRWQPGGPHGPSRWLDHDRFAWRHGRWQPPPLPSAVLYELHVGTFTPEGTFDGVIGKLDHLVQLGVTHVELMPVAEFPGGRGWGYDGVDLFAPHHAYGGPEGLKRLVDACHGRGLAVLLDVVYNHLGPSGNYLARFGPYFTDRYHTPWGDAVNLDGPESDEVRRFFIENAVSWLRDYRLDGLRLDAVHALLDASAIHFLEELAAEVAALQAHLGRRLVLIAESDLNDPRLVRSPEAGGYGLDAQWNEDFHHALHAALTGERRGYYADFGSLAQVAGALTRGFVLDGRYSAYRRRRHGRPATGVPPHRFVACLQNHDQVGNRAVGERTSHLLTPGQLKIGAALVLTSPFVPLLFQGEEWGASTPFLYFTAHQEPELAEAVRKGRQAEFAAFGWNPDQVPDPQAEDTFSRSVLDWPELGRAPHAELLRWHRDLLRLRRHLPALADGRPARTRVRWDDAGRWLAVERGPLLVACNLSASALDLSAEGRRALLLASEPGVAAVDGRLSLPPHAVAVLGEE